MDGHQSAVFAPELEWEQGPEEAEWESGESYESYGQSFADESAWEDEQDYLSEAAYEAPAQETGSRPLLKQGSRGPDVVRLQRLLNDFLRVSARDVVVTCAGSSSPQRARALTAEQQQLHAALRQRKQLPLALDGVFGPSTEQTVRHFQHCRGLVGDGKVGPVTWDYLESRSSKRVHPPEPRGCGVPARPAAELEHELDVESEMLDETRRRRGPAVRPRLSLFLNDSVSSARNHFQCQATRTARRLGAMAVGRDDPCRTRRVGPTSYDTGADIVGAISSAHTCLEQRIGVVHVFGHSGSGGIYGSSLGRQGLYDEADADERPNGARSITDIPAAALTEDVVVVLHGCNQGAGSDSFAERLYRHLRGALRAPVVLAHHNSGCAGRDNSWIRFDNRHPTGRRLRTAAPHHSGDGCCSPAPRRELEIPASGSAETWGEAWGEQGESESPGWGEQEAALTAECGCRGR
jgi:hypothetical protein